MSTQNIVLKWGAIGGAVTIVLGLVAYLLGLSDSKLMLFASVLIILAVIVLGLFEYRDRLGGGFASFSGLFKVGLMIGLIVSVFSTLWTFLNLSYLDVDYLERLLFSKKIELESMNLPKADFDKALKLLPKNINSLSTIAFKFSLSISGFVSLVSSIVIKDNKPEASLNNK